MAVCFAVAWIACPFPIERLERWPASPVVTDRTGQPLLTLVGHDDQFRIPVPMDRISPWLVQATIAVEDERFYTHPGIDPIAVVRAAGQNLRAARVVSGASTLTMQICRMMDDRPRTWRAKAIEAFRALQLERRYSKRSILETYLNIAPYGRNLRGVEAAARAYFGKHAADLSLGEAALLAGLPQSPSRHRPDRYPDRARSRRVTVLRRMAELGMISEQQRQIAAGERLHLDPPQPRKTASHAAWWALRRRPAGGRTTIDPDLQNQAERLAIDHARTLPVGSDLAVVIIDIAGSDIVAMVGSADDGDPVSGQVNGALARRSPGSTLKPFIYAAAFQAGRLAPDSIVYDVPIDRCGWAPANFNRHFAGALPAAEALRRSLNVPAILVAEGTGLARCLGLIEAVGVGLPNDILTRGGLATVVGAVEVRLLDLVNGYATLGRGGVGMTPRLFEDEPANQRRVLGANICAAINDILSSNNRSPRGTNDFASATLAWFMWKTGTSSGRRDAWAVGHNGRFAIGVWVGRFSGAGRTAFVGARVAEPLLTKFFQLPAIRLERDPLPAHVWAVKNPLPPPPEWGDRLRITAPADRATFIALSGEAIIHPRASRAIGVTWFLNGGLLESGIVPRLVLPPGRYELRGADPTGAAAAVTFTVRSSQPNPIPTPNGLSPS